MLPNHTRYTRASGRGEVVLVLDLADVDAPQGDANATEE